MEQVMILSATHHIDEAVRLYRAMLEIHVGEFDSRALQSVLGQPGLAADQLAALRARGEAISKMIVRRVKVNRSRTPMEVIYAAGRSGMVDLDVVDAMPRAKCEEVDVHFFRVKRYVNDVDLDYEFKIRGLLPADPYSLAAVNEDSAFADTCPNVTYWKDDKGQRCYAAFRKWRGERQIRVDRIEYRVHSCKWLFAGLLANA